MAYYLHFMSAGYHIDSVKSFLEFIKKLRKTVSDGENYGFFLDEKVIFSQPGIELMTSHLLGLIASTALYTLGTSTGIVMLSKTVNLSLMEFTCMHHGAISNLVHSHIVGFKEFQPNLLILS